MHQSTICHCCVVEKTSPGRKPKYLPRKIIKLLLKDPKTFPGQKGYRYIIHPVGLLQDHLPRMCLENTLEAQTLSAS